uniref:Uncharacterized protein n=1 Tax=Bos indicus x Bos taurus TaxID=30522 RepID=A0A4W2BL53_BOBOX
VTAVKLGVQTLFPGGCPQALATEWWEGIVLPVVFFRFDGTCQFFSGVLQRQEGGVYFIEFEGKIYLQIIHVTDNILVFYYENDDGEKITKVTEGSGTYYSLPNAK